MQPVDQLRGFSRNRQRGVGARSRLRRIFRRPRRYLAGCCISEEIARGKRKDWMQLKSPYPTLLEDISLVTAPLARQCRRSSSSVALNDATLEFNTRSYR